MTYRIVHKTTYRYKHAVSFGNHAVYLAPRSQVHHRCESYELLVTPAPAAQSERADYFGNRVSLFTIQEPHEDLIIEARSRVTIHGGATWPKQSMAWDEAAAALPGETTPASLEALQFVFESPRIRPNPEFAAYAAASFPPGRPLAEALLHFTARIHGEFHFDSKATDVRTPPEEVLRKRKGVCQDFAHLQIACLRSLNLPARYVSGYLRTYPPPGRPRLVGADASHAWVSVYCPGAGWLDLDPTNNVVPSESHVTLAWGRDYSDVSPVRGVILGGKDHT
ncbi:MAG TPA: transglutaminase family protein, partial [Bryobacteraceae bacterium]|nr:transglutaminase family protein [Bryobacteraceae bacterium]